jgi:hypothetical protein
MPMLLGLDIHRQQITFDVLDPEMGELERGRIQPATRESVRAWLARYHGRELEAALEATTGWRFVAEELERVGARVHLAEPAETAARRGPKRRRIPTGWTPATTRAVAGRVGCQNWRRACKSLISRARTEFWHPSPKEGPAGAKRGPRSGSKTSKLHKRLHTRSKLEIVQINRKKKVPLCRDFAEPSDGLEPSTPSLP